MSMWRRLWVAAPRICIVGRLFPVLGFADGAIGMFVFEIGRGVAEFLKLLLKGLLGMLLAMDQSNLFRGSRDALDELDQVQLVGVCGVSA